MRPCQTLDVSAGVLRRCSFGRGGNRYRVRMTTSTTNPFMQPRLGSGASVSLVASVL
jgi:hypothetical protein